VIRKVPLQDLKATKVNCTGNNNEEGVIYRSSDQTDVCVSLDGNTFFYFKSNSSEGATVGKFTSFHVGSSQTSSNCHRCASSSTVKS